MPAAAPIPAPYLEYAAEAALSDVDSFADSLYASCMAAGKVTSEWEARCPGRRFDEANQRRAEMRRAITRLREADRAASGSHWGFGDTLSNERYAAEMEVERLIGGMR